VHPQPCEAECRTSHRNAGTVGVRAFGGESVPMPGSQQIAGVERRVITGPEQAVGVVVDIPRLRREPVVHVSSIPHGKIAATTRH